MGWKAIKDHYRIGHSVAVYPDKGVCIGSPYVHDLVVIDARGNVTPNRIVRNEGGELGRYIEEMRGDPETLRRLIDQPDTFERSVPVFTYEGAHIIECQCEELGWPNVTHDGRIMYENTFSPDRAQVIEWAIQSAEAGVEGRTIRVAELTAELANAEASLRQRQADLAALKSLSTPSSGDNHDH